jgi:hypothetical protein
MEIGIALAVVGFVFWLVQRLSAKKGQETVSNAFRWSILR